MKNNIRTLFISIVFFIAVGTFYYYYNNEKVFYKNDESTSIQTDERINDESVTDESVNVSDHFSLPARIHIPSLGIDAKVNHVGLTDKGDMATPGNFKDVGWYKYGTIPGNRGSAVIAGHLDNAIAKLGVFKELEKLKRGDDVYIETADGTRAHFKVIKSEKYPYDKSPNEEIFNNTSSTTLNLVTCAGYWNKTLKTYTERLVVYTELVNE